MSDGERGGFVFRRKGDAVSYVFDPDGDHSGRPAWRRRDKDLRLVWGELGWIVRDPDGVILSRPWLVDTERQGDHPPEGVWVSRKGDKAYVYDCMRL